MHSLGRIFLFVVVLLAAGCGGSEPTPYIKSWNTPFASIQGGTTAPFSVELSMAVKDKTYIDITPNPGDELYVTTHWGGVKSQYIIIAAGTSSGVVDITAESVTHTVTVTLNFKIRDSKEQRSLTFDIKP